ncbi:endonuclease domain-containing protein [Arthrobacter sp. FW305-123]|nr:endonuclease domain-containing protein [Arthrobacter sp. FW305-123]
MQNSTAFPPRLITAPFTLEEADAAGLKPSQLWSSVKISGVSRGLYRHTDWDFELSAAARSLSAATPGAWISHVTAARLHGFCLPPWLSDSNELHLSKPRHLPSVRRKGVIGHTVIASADEVEYVRGIRMSTRSRTWLDLARRVTVPDLVCMGDELIRIPRPEFEERETPFTTLEALRKLVDRHKNLQGVVRAREALDLMRVGADSAPESLLRLAMLDAGIPEPELQVKLRPSDPFSPSADLGFRARRVALQYDGGHHQEREQIFSDRRRDKAFEAAGWTVLKFGKEDLADNFSSATKKIKSALRSAWQDPAVSSGFSPGT